MESERESVALARNGDEHAFASLYHSYARPVYLILAGIVRYRDDAKDLLQSVFLTAWRRLPSLRDPAAFAPWLCRIARNRARDLLRRRRLEPRPLPDAEDLVGPEGFAPPEVDDLRRLVAGLKPETRALVLLRCVEEWTTEEIAAALSISASTVRRRLDRALAHLREMLTKTGAHHA